MTDLLSPGSGYAGYFTPTAILTTSGALAPANTPVTVYNTPDGSTLGSLATIGSDYNDKSGGANPVLTDSYGNLEFFAEPGFYILSFTLGGITTTYPVMVPPWFTDCVWNVVTDTATASPLSGDCRLADTASSGLIEQLPTPTIGFRLKIVKTDDTVNLVEIQTPSGTIFGPGLGNTGANPLYLVGQGDFAELISDGSNYYMVGGIPDSAWQVPALLNGWVNNGGPGPTNSVAWRKQGNIIRLGGSLINTSATAAIVFQLPAGSRPPAIAEFIYRESGGASIAGVLEVDTLGNVYIYWDVGTSSVFIDGITFTTD